MSVPEERTTPSVPEAKPAVRPLLERGERPGPGPSARDRRGRHGRSRPDERAAEPAPQVPEPTRTWKEKHGGTLVICFTFAALVLLVVAKNACG